MYIDLTVCTWLHFAMMYFNFYSRNWQYLFIVSYFALRSKEMCTKFLSQIDFMKRSVLRPNLGGGRSVHP